MDTFTFTLELPAEFSSIEPVSLEGSQQIGGPQGEPGREGAPGKSLINKGAFVLGSVYDSTDFVFDTGTSGSLAVFFSKRSEAFTATTAPRSDPASWIQLEPPAGKDGKDGSDGDEGPQGPQGNPGAQGEPGPAGRNGADGAAGANGRDVQLQRANGYIQWRYVGASTWNNLLALTEITGPEGDQGPQGDAGLQGPQGNPGTPGAPGKDGANGVSPTLKIGTVATGAAGSAAAATISGSFPNYSLNLTIPQGQAGSGGGSEIGDSKSFISEPQVITSAGSLTLTHGLGRLPEMLSFSLVCVTAESTFSVGDRIYIDQFNNNATRGLTVRATEEELFITFGSSANVFQVHAATGNGYALNNANWKLVVVAQIGGRGLDGAPGLPGADGAPGATGAPGTPGQDGVTPTLAVGGIITGEPGSAAAAQITGTGPNYVINFVIPRGNVGQTGAKGDQGPQGDPGVKGDTGPKGADGTNGTNGTNGVTPTLAIGTVTTGAAGASAAASITGSGPGYQLNLTLPRGATGAKGDTGPQGLPGTKGDTGDQGIQGIQGVPGQDGTDGIDGDDGISPTITIGTITTGAAGSSATATLTGTFPDYVLNMTIPRGNTGAAATITYATTAQAQAGTVTTVVMNPARVADYVNQKKVAAQMLAWLADANLDLA